MEDGLSSCSNNSLIFSKHLFFFFLDELLYAAFRSPLPYFFTFKKKYYRISIVMPAIIEFIVGILGSSDICKVLKKLYWY